MHIGMMQFSTIEKREEILALRKHSLNEELQSIKNMEYHSGRRTMLGNALRQVNNEVNCPKCFYWLDFIALDICSEEIFTRNTNTIHTWFLRFVSCVFIIR